MGGDDALLPVEPVFLKSLRDHVYGLGFVEYQGFGHFGFVIQAPFGEFGDDSDCLDGRPVGEDGFSL
ncbi:hypothetical protein NOJ16_28120, partial [Neorhizobium galegae]|nr:hypothetical protein [Neorhizobium galegae]